MRIATRHRVLLVVTILAGVNIVVAQSTLQAGMGPSIGSYGLCDEECGPAVSCEQECWAWAPDLPLFESTCGNWSGPPWGGIGQCLGTCGDDYCNEYNEEDMASCYEDCGECGDDICTSGPESAALCYEDCDYCDSGICTFAELCGAPGECEEDCGPCGELGDECEEVGEECGDPGEVCSPQKYCVLAGDRSCGGDPHGCCPGEIWWEINCDAVYYYEGSQAGDACVIAHCIPTYGCGICLNSSGASRSICEPGSGDGR